MVKVIPVTNVVTCCDICSNVLDSHENERCSVCGCDVCTSCGQDRPVTGREHYWTVCNKCLPKVDLFMENNSQLYNELDGLYDKIQSITKILYDKFYESAE